MSARFFSTGIRDTLVSMSEAKAIVQGVVETTAATAESATATAAGNYFVFGMSSFQVIPLSYY
jgi:hypothetical protein